MSFPDPNGGGGIVPGWNELEASLQDAATRDNTASDAIGAGTNNPPATGADGYYTDQNGNPTGNRPLTVEEKSFQNTYPNGGMFSNPLSAQTADYNTQVANGGNPPSRPLTVEEQAFQGTYPNGGAFPNTPQGPQLPGASAPGSSLPSASTNGYAQPLLGGTPVTGPQLPGAASGDMNADQRLVRDASGNVVGVRSANGYYDQNFQSTDNMLRNYQQGDRVPGTVDALRILAEMGNGNAKAVLGADTATGSNMMGSQLEADWAKRHNAEIQSRLTGGAFQGNGAAQQNLTGQQVQVNGTPNSDAQSFPMAQKMMDDLTQVKGVRDVKLDGYGNVVFTDDTQKSANNPTGVAHIPMNEWADWYPVIVDRLAKQDAPAVTDNTGNGGGNGRNAPRSNGGGGGGGGGAQNSDVTSTAAGNPEADALAAQRLAEFFPTADSRKGVPRSVASAVGYSPSITPGGFSPYDQ